MDASLLRDVRTIAVLAVILLVPVGCGGEESTGEIDPRGPSAEQEALERARQAADALGGELMQRLLAEMEQGGPTAAVQVCSDVAQSIAHKHSTEGRLVRRVSQKVRNPADLPDAYERSKLQELQELHADGHLPAEVVETVDTLDGRALRYMRPIKIVQPCLVCHGDKNALDPGVAAMLATHYPDDQATGYRTGDLRGAISVTVELGSPDGDIPN